MDMTRDMTRDQVAVQAIAEALYSVATSDNKTLASWDCPVYRALERALVGAVRAVYGVGVVRAWRVRDLLAELGPHDSCRGTQGSGIYSYVQYVQANRP